MSYDPNQSNNPDATPPSNEHPNQSNNPETTQTPPEAGHSYPPPSEQFNANYPPPSEQFNANYPPPPGPAYGYAPPPGYGYPPYPYPGTEFNPPPAQPLPLGVAIKQLPAQYLRVISKPGAAIFFQEKSKAAWNIIWFQIACLAVLNALFVIIVYGVMLPTLYTMMSTNGSSQLADFNRLAALPTSLGALIFTPILLFASMGIYYLIARAFGGQGTFREHMYSYMLIYVPEIILALLIGWIPIVGSLAIFAAAIYAVVLQVYMTMAVHRLSGGKATLAVLILPIIGIVLACGLVGILVAFAVHMTQQMQ